MKPRAVAKPCAASLITAGVARVPRGWIYTVRVAGYPMITSDFYPTREQAMEAGAARLIELRRLCTN